MSFTQIKYSYSSRRHIFKANCQQRFLKESENTVMHFLLCFLPIKGMHEAWIIWKCKIFIVDMYFCNIRFSISKSKYIVPLLLNRNEPQRTFHMYAKPSEIIFDMCLDTCFYSFSHYFMWIISNASKKHFSPLSKYTP